MIRIFLSIRDPERRAAVVRMVRSDENARLVGSEPEADLVIQDTSERIALAAHADEELTAREIEVLSLVAEGMDNRAIGTGLGITRSTVKHHLEAIYAKLDVHGRTAAVKEGFRRGLVPL